MKTKNSQTIRWACAHANTHRCLEYRNFAMEMSIYSNDKI